MEALRRKLEADSLGLYNCTVNPNCDGSTMLEYCWSCVYLSPPPPHLPPPPPPPLVSTQNHVTAYLVSAVCALGVAFLILTTCGILLRCRWWRRRNSAIPPISTDAAVFRDEDHGPVDHPIWRIVTIGLPDSVIESITAAKYKKGEGLIEGTDCSVCLTEFEEGEDLRILPKCNHAFHITCIDTWLRSHQNCPLCRSAVVNLSSSASNSSEPGSFRTVRVENPLNRLDENVVEEEEEESERAGGLEPLSVEILKNENWGKRALSDLGENHRVAREDFQSVRRTNSLGDSAASAIISNAVVIDFAKLGGEGSSKQQKLVDVEEEDECQDSSISRLMKSSSSIGISLQKAPVSMKRSISSSSARILSSFRGSKSQSSSILPL